MKKPQLFLTSILIILTNFALFSQTTINSRVGVVILEGLTMTETSQMHFGAMTIPSSPTEVILSTTKTRNATSPSAISLVDQAPYASNAIYSVAGSPNGTYSINLPEEGTVTISNGTSEDDILVDSFTSRPSSTGSDSSSGNLNGFGEDSFSVGATLRLNANQHSGVYSGSYNISINYN